MFCEKREGETLKAFVSLVCISLSGLLLACSSVTPPSAAPTEQGRREQPVSQAPTSMNSNRGQQLPITAQVTIAGQVIQLEVAKTPQQQALGFMYRQAIAANRGMLFSFSPPRPVGFWMKNVVVPLDMVFLQNGKVTAIEANVPPCQAEPCPTYGPATPIDQVIELRGGRAAELGIQVGDRLAIKFLQTATSSSSRS